MKNNIFCIVNKEVKKHTGIDKEAYEYIEVYTLYLCSTIG